MCDGDIRSSRDIAQQSPAALCALQVYLDDGEELAFEYSGTPHGKARHPPCRAANRGSVAGHAEQPVASAAAYEPARQISQAVEGSPSVSA